MSRQPELTDAEWVKRIATYGLYAAPVAVGVASIIGTVAYGIVEAAPASKNYNDDRTTENKKRLVRARNVTLTLFTLVCIGVGGGVAGAVASGGREGSTGGLVGGALTFAAFVTALVEMPKRTRRLVDAVKDDPLKEE